MCVCAHAVSVKNLTKNMMHRQTNSNKKIVLKTNLDAREIDLFVYGVTRTHNQINNSIRTRDAYHAAKLDRWERDLFDMTQKNQVNMFKFVI